MNKTAIFPGSFDPMTIGHLNILKRAIPVFDRIIVAVGINTEKNSSFPLEERLRLIKKAVNDMPNVEVATYSSLTTDFCRQVNAKFILRGIRSMADFEYERNIAEINKMLAPDIETICLFAEPSMSAISSSMVRELKTFGKNIDEYIA